MKKMTSAAVVFVACFAAVFSALQINRAMGDGVQKEQITPIYKTELVPAGLQTPAGAIDFRDAAKKVTPSVVTVDQFKNNGYYGNGEAVQTGTGSGVIFSADGIIVTNNHVVSGASQVKVRLSDHRTFEAKVLGTDSRSDIAVLKINAKDLIPIEVGDSTKLEVGQWVVAVGNPLGFDNTVSVGVVSSLGRSLGVENSVMTDAIQTDAAINPGNSGGALTDAGGRLVGINAVIASPNRQHRYRLRHSGEPG
jgi:serine protease Do